jgi:hypothetical protein
MEGRSRKSSSVNQCLFLEPMEWERCIVATVDLPIGDVLFPDIAGIPTVS